MEKEKVDLLFIENLKRQVEEHPILKTKWLLEKKKGMSRIDLLLWLSQEFFVSKAFVNWFLLCAASAPDISSKIILVENVWEELGEGKAEYSHIEILKNFVKDLGMPSTEFVCFPETSEYLSKMETLIKSDFYIALGALGPANEYLLKLEYAQVSQAYLALKEKEQLPQGKFFQVNLEADEGHSKRLFDLIQDLAFSDELKGRVFLGNKTALEARGIFYKGLEIRTKF